MASTTLLTFVFAILSISLCANALSVNYYDHTCPNLEATITKIVKKAMTNDKTIAAAILRMHFHDCFVRGCDASVLLNSTPSNKAEKDGAVNISLHAFYVIDMVKKELEALCPGVVSCADTLALVARDVVTLSGGPTWNVPKGRLDGRISVASEARQLPAPVFNISQLQQSFSQRGLSLDDLVALSVSYYSIMQEDIHGFAHCSSFQNRIHNFAKTQEIDPSMQQSFATKLKNICPLHNKVNNAGATLDSTTAIFDNAYFKLLLQGQSILTSDQALLTNARTRGLVTRYASSQEEFYKAFANSMIKMSSILGNGKEVRKDCRVVN